VQLGSGETEFGPGVNIEFTGEEVATAIEAWLVAHEVCVRGPRTISVNGDLCQTGRIYVDPSGTVIHEGKRFSGRGNDDIEEG